MQHLQLLEASWESQESWDKSQQFFSLLTQLQVIDAMVWKMVSFLKPEVIVLK